MSHEEDPRTPAWALRRLLAIVSDDEDSWHRINAEIAAANGCWSCLARDADCIAAEILEECGDRATAIAWVEQRLARHLEIELVDPVDDDELPQWEPDPYPRHWLDDAPPPDDRTPAPHSAIDARVREVLRHAVRGEDEAYHNARRHLAAESDPDELLKAFARVYQEDLVAHQGQRLTVARLDGTIKAGWEQAAEESEER